MWGVFGGQSPSLEIYFFPFIQEFFLLNEYIFIYFLGVSLDNYTKRLDMSYFI